MDQNEARVIVENASKAAFTLYWKCDANLHPLLSSLGENLNDLLTELNQDDLKSRTEAFNNAVNIMNTSILPAVQKLDAQIESMIVIEGVIKSAMEDILKLSLSSSFFKIPSI